MLEKRRSIERLFLELDTGRADIERALAEITSGDDAVALDLRLKNLTEFVASGNERCEHIESGSQTAARLKNDYAALQAHLAPFGAAEDGVTRRLKDLSEARDRLAAQIESLQHTPEGLLAERVDDLADDKSKLANDVAEINSQFSRLAELRKDIGGLLAKLEAALDVVAVGTNGRGNATVDDRIAGILDVHRRDAGSARRARGQDGEVFGQLKAQLAELQSRLVPLEAHDSGVVSLVGQVQDIRDKLVAKVGRLEEGDSGDLAARVKTFAEAKRELENRVSVVTEHFSQLATVRKDLAGLFEKLSSAATTSSNGST